MSAAAAGFYVTGGTLRPDAPSYVERQADQDLYEGLLAGEFCYVLHARQMGKSSLMAHTTIRLRAEGIAVVNLDLTRLGQNLTVEQWYEGLLGHIGRQLDLEDELEAYWEAHERQSPLQRWLGALQAVVLAQVPGRLVIAIDEIDAVRSLPFSTDEFFAALRDCYNRRTQDPEFEQLTFCLLGVATPSDLIQDTRTTPFNIGKRIELTDFTPAEATPLADGLGPDPRTRQALLARVLYWTGGHPYLTQRLCRAVAGESSVIDPGGVDRLCEALFLSASAQEKDDNLLFVRERLLNNELDLAGLLDLYGQVRRGQRVALDDTNQLVSLLRLSGITRVVGGHLRVRNRIYERVFDKGWVTNHMPDAELRRQKAAYRRGLLRAAAIGGTVALVMVGLALMAATQARLARRQARVAQVARGQEREARLKGERLLYDADVQLAAQVWDSERGSAQAVQALLEAHRPRRGEEDLRGWEWRYQWRLLHQGAVTLHTFEAPVHLAVGPHGGLITIGRDRRLKRWARAGRHVIRALDLTAALDARLIALTEDGRTVAVGTAEGTVKLLDVATGHEQRAIRVAGSSITLVRFLPGDRRLITRTGDGTVRMWDASTGQEEEAIRSANPGLKEDTVLSPDGRTMAVGSGVYGIDVSLLDWRKSTDARGLLATLRTLEPRGTVGAVAYSPDGRLLGVGHGNGQVSFWDPSTHRESGRPLTAHATWTTRLAFSPDGRTLATGSQDGLVKLWNVVDRRERRRLKGHTAPINRLTFSADGRRLVTGSEDGTTRVWDGMDRATTAEGRILGRGGSFMFAVAYSPDGNLLASGGFDGAARLWDTGSGRQVHVLRGHAGVAIVKDKKWNWVARVAFSPDGRTLATGGGDSRVVLWDLATERVVRRLVGRPSIPPDVRQDIGSLAFSPDGKILAAGFGAADNLDDDNYGQVIKFWKAGSGREIRTLQGHQNHVVSLAFSPDGQVLASASHDHTVRLWQVSTGRPIRVLTGPDGFDSVAFSPDGRTLAAGSVNGTISLWDAATGREEKVVRGHTNRVVHLTFSRDGRTLASASYDRTAKLWDAETGRELRTLTGHGSFVSGVAFSPDGKTLATSSADKTVRLWEAASWPEIAAWEAEESAARARAALQPVATSDGRTVRLQWHPLPDALGYRVYRAAWERGPGALPPPLSAVAAKTRLPRARMFGTMRAGRPRSQEWVSLTPQPLTATSFIDQSPELPGGRPQTYRLAALIRERGKVVEELLATLPTAPVKPPPGFLGSSINEGALCGSADFNAASGAITIRGFGADIWEKADGFYFLNQPVSGDCQITVQSVSRPTATHEFAKAGLMLRETLDPGARNFYLLTSAAHGLILQWRPTAGDATPSVAVIQKPLPEHTALKLPIRLRLTRRGDTIRAEYSTNNSKSFQAAGAPVTFASPLPRIVYAGLAITSHDTSKISEARFRSLKVQKQ